MFRTVDDTPGVEPGTKLLSDVLECAPSTAFHMSHNGVLVCLTFDTG